MAIEKGMGLKKGEKQVLLGEIEVVDSYRETISRITQEDVVKEGFPDWTPDEFIEFYCRGNRCHQHILCTRIEFRRIT
jgi:hypothetical protein